MKELLKSESTIASDTCINARTNIRPQPMIPEGDIESGAACSDADSLILPPGGVSRHGLVEDCLTLLRGDTRCNQYTTDKH